MNVRVRGRALWLVLMALLVGSIGTSAAAQPAHAPDIDRTPLVSSGSTSLTDADAIDRKGAWATSSPRLSPAETLVDPSDVENRLPTSRVYTGCVRAGVIPGTFLLTGARPTPIPGQHEGDPVTATLMLVGPSVHLGRYLGRRVSVTGSLVPPVRGSTDDDRPIFSVTQVKAIAAGCRRAPSSAGEAQGSRTCGRS